MHGCDINKNAVNLTHQIEMSSTMLITSNSRAPILNYCMCPTAERTDWMHRQSTMSSLKIVIVVRRDLVKIVLETLGL